MKKIIMAILSTLFIAGCVTQPVIQNEKVGDLVFIYNQPHSELAKKEADVMCGGHSYSVSVIGHGYSGKPGSMRIPFACTQKAAIEHGSLEAREEVQKLEVNKEVQRIASIPWGGEEANKFFMEETHVFMLLQCGWAGSVGFTTGNKPVVMLGESYYPSEKATFKNGEYSISFNGGSMSVAYNPRKVNGYISDRRSFTPCAAVRIQEE
ncbi:hypothetical protein [Enterobacter sp.]|uniref:hypothetical protein n=1 Tax=Enterobacter sp. TaxID=42895 RepID=UPI00296ECB59|nr:hypothetical protein [Enterobacter sp.]